MLSGFRADHKRDSGNDFKSISEPKDNNWKITYNTAYPTINLIEIIPQLFRVLRTYILMPNQDKFIQHVRDVLNHLYDYPYLENHPLARQYWPEHDLTSPNRAQRLHRLLLETIEALHPPTAPTKDTSRVRGYHLLVYRYVEEQSVEEIMGQLGYSRRQFFREQRKAIEMLAAELQEKLPQAPGSEAQTEESLDTETERFLSRQRAVNLAEVVQDTVSLVDNLAQTHEVRISCQYNGNLQPVYGSRTLIRQVFLNCLSKIIKQPNTRQIVLHLQPEQKSLLVTLTTSLTDKADDPILNFESVEHLVKKLNGYWHQPTITAGKMVCRFGLPTSDEKVVLVIEDNESVIKAFQRYLYGYNYQVVGITVSRDALQTARRVKPAAITLDIMMPNQDGWDTLQILKNDPDTGHIPVIICSVLEDPELAMSLGAAGYLSKPVAQTELVTMLDQLT